ncbi:MAG TPA: hypothetical protein VGL09_10925 [Methylomirabilota bacterium]
MRRLRDVIPAPLRRRLRAAVDDFALRVAIRAVQRVPVGAPLPAATIARLQRAWGNQGFAARTEYLAAVCALALTTHGPILECGSGATTLLLAALAGRRGVEVWSLEHLPAWRDKVVRAARWISPHATVLLAPLRAYGDFEWYTVPPDGWPRPFEIVVCDGPPWTTQGGRYGLLPVMREHLADGATILLDDAHRPDEQEVLRRWQAEGTWSFVVEGTFARVTVPRRGR